MLVEIEVIQPGLDGYTGNEYGGVEFTNGKGIISESQITKVQGLVAINIIGPIGKDTGELKKEIETLKADNKKLKSENKSLNDQLEAATTPPAKPISRKK